MKLTAPTAIISTINPLCPSDLCGVITASKIGSSSLSEVMPAV
jgi:hypothetical protein